MHVRKLSALLLAGPVVAVGASVTTYTDFNSWLAAATATPNITVVTETFDNNQVNTPGLTWSASDHNVGERISNDEFHGTWWTHEDGNGDVFWTLAAGPVLHPGGIPPIVGLSAFGADIDAPQGLTLIGSTWGGYASGWLQRILWAYLAAIV